ncbi:ABC transporter [Lachnospiraceae bacterium C7]|nr:ABC transporter [Lachnospiraceae bacterium C7]
MLEIKNVMKEYGNKKILKGVNMSLDKGIYGLLGKNGAGKTTLFKIISGYTKKYSGSVSVGNDNSEEKSVGILPQNFQGYGELNVREFLKYVFKLKGLDKEQEYEIDEKIKIFSLEQHEKKLLKNLSGGQLRRVGLAQAFLGNPEVVLLDEPTAGLDPTERVKLKKYLAEVGEKCTILLSTHIVSDLEYISKKNFNIK